MGYISFAHDLSMILGSSAKLQLASEGSDNKPLVESRLDNPNYFEGDLAYLKQSLMLIMNSKVKRM